MDASENFGIYLALLEARNGGCMGSNRLISEYLEHFARGVVRILAKSQLDDVERAEFGQSRALGANTEAKTIGKSA